MIAVLFCMIAILVLQLLTPFWWWIMIVPFVYGATGARTGWKAFGNGFVAAGVVWLGGGLFFGLTGAGIIAARMAGMLHLGNSWLLILATALVAAVAGAVSGYAGFAARAVVKRRQGGRRRLQG